MTRSTTTKSAVKAPRAKKAATEPFAIKNRWTGQVIFTCELARSPANLAGASLARAKNLNEEALRPFKADLFLTLDSLHAGSVEALHLIAKLRDGKVDGSTYGHGGNECACLVGTLAQPRGVAGDELDHDSDRPAERWFMMISPGDVPGKLDSEGNPTGGGYVAQKALEWVLDWCACHGVEVPALEAESAQ